MKPKKEKSMTPSADEDTSLDEAVEAALAKADVKPDSARALADAEERLMAQKIAAANAANNEAEGKPAEDLTELPMVSILARGRDALDEAMQQLRHKKENEPAYVPPPRTTAQQERLNEELEAGRKAQARAQQQLQEQRELAARTNPPDPRDGTSTPVHRSGLMVPDPRKGGLGVYAPTAGL